MQKIVISFLFLLAFFGSLSAQNEAVIYGKISDSKGEPIAFANVSIKGTQIGTVSDGEGNYSMQIAVNKNITILFSFTGFITREEKVFFAQAEKTELNISLLQNIQDIEEIEIIDNKFRNENISRLNPNLVIKIPNASSGIESLIKTFAGVASNTELSSQYSVRGGSFDENLIYVNDIEIYKPMLIRAGQQEGLSFINPDLVSAISFSAGGFQAKYGDKLSSVLDIKYRKPQKLESGFSLSLLGGSAFVGGASKDKKLSILAGARYKTSRYLLSTLETKGEYEPSFADAQLFVSYKVNNKIELNVLSYFSDNTFNFAPEDRRTNFGTIQNAVGLYVDFEGKESDRFYTSSGAFTSIYKPNSNSELKLTASIFSNREEVNYDIEGRYSLNQLDKQIGSETLGDSLMSLGIGRYIDHARNKLYSDVFSLEHRGKVFNDQNTFSWGAKYNKELIESSLNEWYMLDSAGYSLPHSLSVPHTDKALTLASSLTAKNKLETDRFSGFLQNDLQFSNFFVTAGVRFSWWSFNHELLISPRMSMSYKPEWGSDFLFRFSSGVYFQPSFFKEILNTNGTLNNQVKAQKSIHFVLSSDFNFKAWNRPFKLVSELYYKQLSNLIPYQLDNVNIRYFPDLHSSGYAAGIDFKLNGEFVAGVDSWLSFSVMQTKENIDEDELNFIPRPNNQLVSVGLFFQDYIPNYETWTVQLLLFYGTGLPLGVPEQEFPNPYLKLPDYKRVDIGFSKLLKDESKMIGMSKFKSFKYIDLSLEIFNLLGINNTISYTWIKVVPNSSIAISQIPNQFAVPDRLTTRRINLKMTVKF